MVWNIIKVIFCIAVITALWAVAMSMLSGVSHLLDKSPWVGWILSTAFWVGIIWYNVKKDS